MENDVLEIKEMLNETVNIVRTMQTCPLINIPHELAVTAATTTTAGSLSHDNSHDVNGFRDDVNRVSVALFNLII
jgi:hypothetical protein